MTKPIIDISYHNGSPNFAKLKKSASVIILRVQDGGFFDPKYIQFAKECEARKIPYGVYSFCRYSNDATAIAEARMFFTRATTGGLKPNFYFLDVETTGTAKLATATEKYRQELLRLGVGKVGIYIAHHLRGGSTINFNKFDKVWIPRYSGKPGVIINPAYPCDLHQYSEHGRIDGIAGNVDLNRIMKGDLSWYLTGKGAPEKPVVPAKPKKKEYFKTTPGTVKALVTVGVYRDKAFKKKVRTYPKGTEFKGVKVVPYEKITRFKLNTKEDLYITANKEYVTPVYYGSNTLPKRIKLTKTACIYKSPEFSEATKDSCYKAGTEFNITGYAKSKAGTVRLTLVSNGKKFYITANKDYSVKVK